jgi:hypothetical protein
VGPFAVFGGTLTAVEEESGDPRERGLAGRCVGVRGSSGLGGSVAASIAWLIKAPLRASCSPLEAKRFPTGLMKNPFLSSGGFWSSSSQWVWSRRIIVSSATKSCSAV